MKSHMIRMLIAVFVGICMASSMTLAQDASASFLSYTGSDLFPSYLIATASVDWNGDEQRAEDKKSDDEPELEDDEIPLFGDENGSIGVELESVPEGVRVTVEIVGAGFLKKSKWTGEFDQD